MYICIYTHIYIYIYIYIARGHALRLLAAHPAPIQARPHPSSYRPERDRERQTERGRGRDPVGSLPPNPPPSRLAPILPLATYPAPIDEKEISPPPSLRLLFGGVVPLVCSTLLLDGCCRPAPVRPANRTLRNAWRPAHTHEHSLSP